MEDVLGVEVDHTADDVVDDLVDLLGGEFCVVFVELVEEAPVLEVLGYEAVQGDLHAHAHVEHDVGVAEVVEDLHFF